jgi:hypothetical protein
MNRIVATEYQIFGVLASTTSETQIDAAEANAIRRRSQEVFTGSQVGEPIASWSAVGNEARTQDD